MLWKPKDEKGKEVLEVKICQTWGGGSTFQESWEQEVGVYEWMGMISYKMEESLGWKGVVYRLLDVEMAFCKLVLVVGRFLGLEEKA